MIRKSIGLDSYVNSSAYIWTSHTQLPIPSTGTGTDCSRTVSNIITRGLCSCHTRKSNCWTCRTASIVEETGKWI